MAENQIASALMQVESNFSRSVQRFQNAMRGRKGRLANQALAALKREPGPPVYPIRWTSEKQRRAFFASRGFGRGIPARRGNPPAVLEGWQAIFVPTDDGGALVLINDVRHVDFVQGYRAQGFHEDTGYVQLNDVVDDFFREAEDAAVQVFFDAVDPLEGV